jgi:diacylglycerol kinase (ATP)
MRITLIHNPKAGDQKHGRKQLMAALADARHDTTYQSTNERGYKKALKESSDLVLVAGGDGTVAKVACLLLDRETPLSVLPLGTANNLAGNLGFDHSPEEIIACLERGRKRVFDVGVARGPWGKRYFFEAAGGGLLADYLQTAHRESKKTKRTSKEQEITRHVSRLRQNLHDYHAQQCKIDIDGKNISERYLLWEAMNIGSVGPALNLAPRALTNDGQLDFVGVRQQDRAVFMKDLDARLAGRKTKFPMPIRRFRELKLVWRAGAVHFDDKTWPRKKQKPKGRDTLEITVKSAALTIWQPRFSAV